MSMSKGVLQSHVYISYNPAPVSWGIGGVSFLKFKQSPGKNL